MKPALLILIALATAQANITLPAVISDRMVIQQSAPVRIWGRADPGESITVTLRDQKSSTTADATGKWKIFLKPLEPGGPDELTAAGQNTIIVKDVLIREVWIGSGQSNMGFTMARVKHADQEIAAADFPRIRLFKGKLKVAAEPAEDVEGSWQFCSPETVRNSSALGYFFSRAIPHHHHVRPALIQPPPTCPPPDTS